MSKQRPKSRYAWSIAVGLLVALLVLGLRFALPIYQRMRAIEAIERTGAGVEIHWLPNYYWGDSFETRGWRRTWWQQFIPARIAPALANVTHVGVPYPLISMPHDREPPAREAAPGWIAQLRYLPEVESLDLSGTSITDSDLSALPDLPGLQRLDLSGTAVTGPGLRHLGRAPLLRTIVLAETPVSDEAISYLVSLAELERVVLDGTRITDAGLSHLARLPKLRELSVSNTQVTTEGLEELRKMNPRIEISDD